jgi:hypothetical protein
MSSAPVPASDPEIDTTMDQNDNHIPTQTMFPTSNAELKTGGARPLFELASIPLLQKRIYTMLLFSPKFFCASFTWEGFGFAAMASGGNSTSAGYYFMTGLGTMLGVVFASAIIIAFTKLGGPRDDLIAEIHSTLFVGLAAGITAGTLWQVSVNISIDGGYTFSGAFFFVYFMSSLSYFTSASLMRYINGNLLPSAWRFMLAPFSTQVICQELTLALSVGAADAFFVGTDDRVLNYGWLKAFNVYGDTNTFAALCLAGASAFCGFLICQTVLNFFVGQGNLWLDESPSVAVKADKDNNNLQGFAVNNPVYSDNNL